MLRTIEIEGLTYIVKKYHYEGEGTNLKRVIDEVRPTPDSMKKMQERLLVAQAKKEQAKEACQAAN